MMRGGRQTRRNENVLQSHVTQRDCAFGFGALLRGGAGQKGRVLWPEGLPRLKRSVADGEQASMKEKAKRKERRMYSTGPWNKRFDGPKRELSQHTLRRERPSQHGGKDEGLGGRPCLVRGRRDVRGTE